MKNETLKTEQLNNMDLIMPGFFIKSKTNNGDLAKQYFLVLNNEINKPSLVVRKLVLSDNVELYGRDCSILKQYKNKFLFQKMFGLNIETLKTVICMLKKYDVL